MKHDKRLLRIVLFLLTACSSPQQNETTPARVSFTPASVSTTASPTAVIRTFLTWYAQHQTQLNSLPFVPAALDEDSTNVFAVDVHAVDSYVRLLQSSGTVSPAYLQVQRRYFQQCQDSLQAHPQTDGFIQGLDFDHVLYTQAGEAQTQFVLASQPSQVTIHADTARVLYRWSERQMSEGRNLAFSLAREQGRWLITAIRPIE
ncbi:hypothetical protein PK28_17100 (plasmid) [Hymenobacter sp. DG25B]|uniref:hypothetical protein n=1 Tax=Hymenobacter sp. DG25B TaxID=1385664 RepID=UPI000540A1BB|nr:hypothetical protein [Hymenobacter sp. DG25B]AIZ65390.1 hypothetical protein PK28_17100 [Hymenobacter sp. DG25B]